MTKSGIEMEELRASKEFAVRFSEVDSMNVVWHGSYPLYFEDAREAFGKKYGLEYWSTSRSTIRSLSGMA